MVTVENLTGKQRISTNPAGGVSLELLLSVPEMPEDNRYIPLTSHVNGKGKQ